MYVKAIETLYAGVKFRSRLEARWAVFFDALGIRWQYEPEAFEIPNWRTGESDSYLPDFSLPDLGCFVECKGTLEAIDSDYLTMVARCVDYGGSLPGMADSAGSTRGLMWLFGLPDASVALPAHAILQHDEGGWVNGFSFTPSGGIQVLTRGADYFDALGDTGCLRDLLTPYERGLYWREQQASPLLRAAYSEARSARFQQGGWVR